MECIPKSYVTSVVKSLIESSGIPNTAASRILSTLEEFEQANGKILLVQTSAKIKTIHVGFHANEMIGFSFPPNTENFEVELLRALELGSTVTVAYKKNDRNENIIVVVWMYGNPD